MKDPKHLQASSASKVLSIAGLRKRYRDIVAVDGISFDVAPNEIVGLLGPNGAGKTTTINMVLGLLEPNAGSIRIEDIDITRNRSQALERTNFAAVYAPLPGNLTVAQNLRIFGLLYGVKGISERIQEVLEQFSLEAFRDVKCGLLSSGEQTRLGLAKAMLNHPHLLLLDEPTASLDPAIAAKSAQKSGNSSGRVQMVFCGLPTICTRSRRSATGCSSWRMGKFCWRETRRPCPLTMAKTRSKSFL